MGNSSTIFNNSKNLESSSFRESKERYEKKGIIEYADSITSLRKLKWILDHTGGTYSHVGLMDYPRVPISEMHLGKFPDSMEFQRWQLNFRTEPCMRAAESQVTMLWIKEVESS